MLEYFRGAARSLAAKILIGLLVLSFAVWGIADVFRGFDAGAVATVGSREISAAEYTSRFNDTLQDIARRTGQAISPDDARRFGIDRSVLDQLVQGAALDAAATRLGVVVDDRIIVDELARNPMFHDANGNFDVNRLRQLLAQNNMNEQMFFASERQALVRSALSLPANGEIAAPKVLVEAFHKHRSEQRDARYFVVTASEQEVDAPADADIQRYYDEHPAAYTAPEYRSVAIMSAEPKDIAARVQLTDDEIKAGFEKYKQEYFSPERRTVLQLGFPSLADAEAAKARIDAGEDILAIAKERGATETDITFTDKLRSDFLDAAVAEVAFSLAEGAVSAPVQGSLTTALLKVVKIAPEHAATLDEVRPKLAERLQLERALDEIRAVYDAVEDARAAQTPFDAIAERAGIPFLLIPAVDAAGLDRQGKDVAMPHKLELLKATFESDVGVENDAISAEDGYIWYEVREVTPSALRPLAEVRDRVRADLIAARVRDKAAEKAKALVARADSGTSLDVLAQETGAEIKTAQGLKRNEASIGFDNAAVTALFSVPENDFAWVLEGDGKGARVMQPQKVLLPPFDGKDPAAAELGKAIAGGLGSDLLDQYVEALKSELGVSINEKVWQQVAGGQPAQP